MYDFLYQYSMERNDKRINHSMFTREFDKPLYEYLVDSCKNLGVIQQLELVSWEYITDQSKINVIVNKKLSKDKKIRNNKLIDRIVPLSNTLTDLLRLTFKKTIGGQEEYVTREVLVFKKLKSGEYFINGKKALPIHQITENSTFVKDNEVKYKAALFGIDLYRSEEKLKFNSGDIVKGLSFQLNLFEQIINPLLYFFAQYGVDETITKFDMSDIISIVPNHIDTDNYLYVTINKNLFVEINKDAINAHPFILTFITTLCNAISIEKNVTIKQVYDRDYWLEILASKFSKKSVQKGKRVLISFSKIMDPTTRKRLNLAKWHKKDTFSLIRWMMVNFEYIFAKDNHDLGNKRIRTTETIAYYFDAYITRNINSVLNADNITSASLDRLLNSINLFTMMRSIYSNKNNPYSLFRYEKYNDLDAINLSRYTFKGPGGLNGGKYGTAYKYRDIYPSHIDRFDLNVCSSSDPGLTGYLCANIDIKEGGYFDIRPEPDVYDGEIIHVMEPFKNEVYKKSRKLIKMKELSKNEDGNITLSKKLTPEEISVKIKEDPAKYGLYRLSSGLYKLIPRYEKNKKGNIVLSSKAMSKNGKILYKVNEKGQIQLEVRDGKEILKSKKR